MTTEQTRVLTQRLSAARAAANAEEIVALLAEDVVHHKPSSTHPEPSMGRESVANALTGAPATKVLHAETIKREVTLTAVDGDLSVVRVRLTGRTLADVDYDNDYIWIYTWSDGKVVRIDEHSDTFRAVQKGVSKGKP